MKTPCPHCKVQIEIDPPTLTALAGHRHFNCPACQGAIAVPSRPIKLASAQHGISRNLLILGSVALLALGGIGFYLASQKSGDTQTSIQDIRNEIIYNSYFQNLIATGITTKQALGAIEDIRPYQDGFIGVSAKSLDWKQANDLARLTGSAILAGKSESAQKLVSWISTVFQKDGTSPLWMTKTGAPAIIVGSEVISQAEPSGKRKVLLHWRPAELAAIVIEDKARIIKANLSNWKIVNGEWADEYGGRTGNGKHDAFLLSDIHGSDFQFEADIRIKTNIPSAGSLVFRAEDDVYKQCYIINISTEEGGIIKLFKLPYETLAIHKTVVKTNIDYRLKVITKGENIKVYLGSVNLCL